MKFIPLLLLALWSRTGLSKDCFKESISLNDNDFKVEILRYPSPQSRKNIIIIPPTGGTNIIDRSYARMFCDAGFNTIVLNHFTDDDEYNLELSIHTRYYARNQRAIDLIVKSLDPKEFIGILGTSVGAFHAAIAAGRLERISAAFTITGGADIASIIVNSDQDAMQVAYRKRMDIYGFKNAEEYLHALREHIILDPLKFKGHVGKDLGLVWGSQDTVVPTANQLMLKDLWRPQFELKMENNHFLAIVKTWLFHSSEVISFFKESASKLSKKI